MSKFNLQLRNGQSVCTDNECTDLVQPQQQNSAGGDSVDNFTFMMFMMIAAVILYVIRPNSLRRRNNEGLKPTRDNNVRAIKRWKKFLSHFEIFTGK